MKKIIILAAHGLKQINIDDIYAKIVKAVELNFSKNETVLGFTSKTVITFLKEIFPKQEYCVEKLIVKYLTLNYDEIFIQPLFINSGIEYKKIVLLKEKYHEIKLGKPLINDAIDFYQILKLSECKIENSLSTPILFVIHGNNYDDEFLLMIQNLSKQNSYKFLICALENNSSIVKVIEYCKDRNIIELFLFPLFVAPGGHVLNDLLCQKSTSLVSKLDNNGIKIKKVFKTLSENDVLIDILLDKMNSLTL